MLAYDYAAAAQLIRSGRNGELTPLDDERAFVAKACALADDMDGARALGAMARESALTHGWEPVVVQVEQILRYALACAAPAPTSVPLQAARQWL